MCLNALLHQLSGSNSCRHCNAFGSNGSSIWNVVNGEKDEKSTQTEVIVATPSAPTPEEELWLFKLECPGAGSLPKIRKTKYRRNITIRCSR